MPSTDRIDPSRGAGPRAPFIEKAAQNFAWTVQLFEDIEFRGRDFTIVGETPDIGGFMGSGDGQASSAIISSGNSWIILWEGANYQNGNDQLWIAPPGLGNVWKLHDLQAVNRQHGNNNWNDRIRCIKVSRFGPIGSNDNRTIVYGAEYWAMGNADVPPY